MDPDIQYVLMGLIYLEKSSLRLKADVSVFCVATAA